MNIYTRARYGTAALFVVDGVGFGVWAAHIPAFRDTLHLSPSSLSTVLLALVVGSILTMPAAGAIIQRSGSRLVAWTAVLAYLFAVLGLSFVASYRSFVLFAALFGAAKGALDVSINAQGVFVEKCLGKPIVSSFQGFWSAGGLVGATASSFTLHHGFGIREDFLIASALLTIFALVAAPTLLVEPSTGSQPSGKSGFRTDARLLRLASIAFLGLFAEGAMADWDGVYLKSSIGVTLSQAAFGYAAFSVAMALGRFAGDFLIARFQSRLILRVSGMLLCAGVLLAVVGNVWWSAIIGFILAGSGIANIVPVIWGSAGRDRTIGAGPALATVTTVGYFGFLAGPPLIGFLATTTTLRLALGLVATFGLAIAAMAGFATELSPAPSTQS